MHLLKVYLDLLSPSCFITTKSTTIFSTQDDGLEMELFLFTAIWCRMKRPFLVGWTSHSLHSLIPCWFIEGQHILVDLYSHSL